MAGFSLTISEVIAFLETVKETAGDLKLKVGVDMRELKPVTGFWVETVKATGEHVVVVSTGDGFNRNESV